LTVAVALSRVNKVFPDGTQALSDLDLRIDAGELMVIVGPSGCGKTTTLRITAGLEELSDGEIHIGERLVNGLDPRERDVAMVFQNYALYPNMNVYDNLAFPLRAHRLPKAEVNRRVERTAKLLDLEDVLKRKPRALSGGQRQRVAMGRAIVREPQVFLMDEPLSNLDAKLRAQLRSEIVALQRELGVTTMYVTHDQVEAMAMGTRIAVMRGGVLQQVGPPQQLYDEPENLFVATFIGSPVMNLVEARIERNGHAVECVLGDQRLRLGGMTAQVAALAAYVGADVALGVRAEHLGDPATGRLDRPRLRGRVQSVELLGAERLVQIELPVTPLALEVDRDTEASVERRSGDAIVTARFDAHARVEPGNHVEVAVTTEWLHFFDLTTGRAIREASRRR
jgi:multiple sugar transport system ATP-binding protein